MIPELIIRTILFFRMCEDAMASVSIQALQASPDHIHRQFDQEAELAMQRGDYECVADIYAHKIGPLYGIDLTLWKSNIRIERASESAQV